MTINQRIREIRRELNLSQAKFAEAIAISNGYIACIELGNRKVNDRMIKLICITFHVREEWLRTGAGPMFEAQPDLWTEQAVAAFRALRPEYQEYILKQIDLLLELQKKEQKRPRREQD